jgi:hypothetical protein
MKYLIILDHRYRLDDGKDITWLIELNLEIKRSPISFDAILTCFSNSEQKYAELEKSIITEFLTKDESIKCIEYYTDLKDNYIQYLYDTIKTQEQLDKYIETLHSPTTKYNYKLLNVFTLEELEYINNELFTKYVLLDPNNFKEFKEDQIDGWYALGVEVNTDLDDNDYPEILHIINNDEIPITAKEALAIMKENKKKYDN